MIGKNVLNYKIIDKIGEGGMGEVYLAEDTKLERKVAIKFLPQHLTKDKENVERFEREAKAAASLNHPNIITIYEINEYDSQIFIVMEYVEGRSLRYPISETRHPIDDVGATGPVALTVEDTINYISQICEGLSKAHQAGIVHRDIKPENILIDRDGRVKILDFGLAKLKGVSKLTKESSTLGTVHYMSPEQIQGREVDHRSDIWSVGVLLYEMLTGEVPFQGEYEQSVTYAILNEEPKSIKTDVPDSMIIVINKCLQKIPADRYQSIQEFSEDLKNNQKVITADKPNKIGMAYKKTIAIVSILVTTILFMFIYTYFQSKENKVFDSIAVLPLKNLSGNPKEEWFSDAMTEALITELYSLKSLKVISLTSTLQFKGTDLTLPVIAEMLNVSALVEGSALIIGDQVKISAKLIDTEQDQYLWAEDYIRDMEDVFVLQKDAAKAIALRVKSTLLPEEKLAFSNAKKVNPKAYEAYGQGKFYLYKFTKPDVEIAIRSFHSALTYQNDFALAYAALAEAYNIMSTLGWISSKTGWVKSKENALKALVLDNSLAEAYTMLADVKYLYDRDWKGAESEFKKAIAINPSYSTGHTWYATFLSAMGRHEEAISEIKIAQELDPLFFRPKITAANVYMYARQYQNAEQQLLELIDLNSALPLAHNRLGKLYLLNGRYEDAILELEKSCELANDSTCVPRLAQAFALNGNIIKAKQLLDYWLNSKQKNIQATEVALAYLTLGEKKKAFEWLYKAFNNMDEYMHKLLVDPSFDPIRNDKRYIDLLKKVGLNP